MCIAKVERGKCQCILVQVEAFKVCLSFKLHSCNALLVNRQLGKFAVYLHGVAFQCALSAQFVRHHSWTQLVIDFVSVSPIDRDGAFCLWHGVENEGVTIRLARGDGDDALCHRA